MDVTPYLSNTISPPETHIKVDMKRILELADKKTKLIKSFRGATWLEGYSIKRKLLAIEDEIDRIMEE